MRYVDAIKFFFRDENWTHNALIGAIFTVIPVIGPIALAGWHCEVAQRLARKDPYPIPKLEFNDLIPLLQRGIAPFVAQLIVILPISLVYSIIVGVAAPLIAVVGQGSTIALIALAVVVVFSSVLLAIFVVIAGSTALTRAELTEDLTKALDVGALLAYAKETFGLALVGYFILSLIALPLAMVGMLLCCVGLYPASVAINLGAVHLRMQIYERYLERGGTPIPIKTQQAPTAP